MTYNGKSILFISPRFFNYEKYITNALQSLGAKVDFFDERPSNSPLVKGLIRVKRELYQHQINKYYKGLMQKINGKKYDFFLLIKGETLPAFFLQYLKDINAEIVSIYYTYDGFENNKNAQSILSHFERKFTFDARDAKDYGLLFRPLFFIEDYLTVDKNVPQDAYDLAFIGTAHSDRYVISEQINYWCTNNGLKYFAYYFSPGKMVLRFRKLFDKTSRDFNFKKIATKSLKLGELIDLYNNAKCVLDIQHPNQTGLTMRTFEVLASGRKLVTTNADVKKYVFYHPNNIFVIDRNALTMEKSFFSQPFMPLPDEMLHRMSLRGWLDCLFLNQSEAHYWYGKSPIS